VREIVAQSAPVGPYTVEATFDPHVVDGKVKCCAVVKAPEPCRY
jgi:hypothetical protein